MRSQTGLAVLAGFMVLSVMLLIPAREASVQDSEDTDTCPFQVENGMWEDDIKAECSDGTNSVELNPGDESDFECTVNSIRISHDSSGSTYQYEHGEGFTDAECPDDSVYELWVVDSSDYNSLLSQTEANIAFRLFCQQST